MHNVWNNVIIDNYSYFTNIEFIRKTTIQSFDF